MYTKSWKCEQYLWYIIKNFHCLVRDSSMSAFRHVIKWLSVPFEMKPEIVVNLNIQGPFLTDINLCLSQSARSHVPSNKSRTVVMNVKIYFLVTSRK